MTGSSHKIAMWYHCSKSRCSPPVEIIMGSMASKLTDHFLNTVTINYKSTLINLEKCLKALYILNKN